MTTATVHLRPDTGLTLDSIRNTVLAERKDTETKDVSLGQVEFRLDGNISTIKVGKEVVPASEKGIGAFGEFLGIPGPFLKRLQKTTGMGPTQNLLTALVEASNASAISVLMGEGGIVEVREAGKQGFDPAAIVKVAQKVLGDNTAPVQRLINTGAEFSFDTHVHFDAKKGVGGDKAKKTTLPEDLKGYSWVSKVPVGANAKVGDLTAGGLRFGLDIKHGLTPWAQPWFLRLACTNGMEVTDTGLRIDGRGQSVEEVMAELEAQAQRAFGAIDSQIEHFYNLRNQKVENPERLLIRTAQERGIPERSLRAMLHAAPSGALPDTPTMFDITNLITNMANNPAMRNDGGRLILERAGGSIINDEAIRCGHCLQKTV